MLELKPKANGSGTVEAKQPRRLVLALCLLLVALAAVLVRDREFWFGSEESTDYEVAAPAAPPQAAKAVPEKVAAAPAPATKKMQIAPAAPAAESKAEGSGAVVSKRTALPPLDVEVVAGDTHRTLHAGSNATTVVITNSASAPSSAASGLTVSAGERERLSTGAGAVPQAAMEASYALPLLAQQMKVQGSVVLQALIGAGGDIQELRVVSGPAILASAARQAVSQWKFKPYLQNGQPVETRARITVNFTIKVADTSPRIS